MALWWLGNVIFLLVIPVLVLLLLQVLRPALAISAYADDVLEHGQGLAGEIDAVDELARTVELVGELRSGLQSYAGALGRTIERP